MVVRRSIPSPDKTIDYQMSSSYVVRDLMNRLREDEFRRSHPFSEDLKLVQDVLFHPYADDGDRELALRSWFQRQQPCLFGRVAAAMDTLHVHFLLDRDLTESDQHITGRIREGLSGWKQRSVSPGPTVSTPAHGFALVLASSRLSYAEPNDTTYQLALEILKLWGCRHTVEPHGDVYWEDLYLQNPKDKSYVKFSFSVDFFGAAGDGRWWHDHRMPGGFGFTANSVGHMRRYREWYEGKGDQNDWVLSTAMKTIAGAADTPYGRATWLRPLNNGVPFVPGVLCPFKTVRSELEAMDWTRYGGHLHTDHSVRPELFRAAPEKSAALTREEWLQDFQYLYDPSSIDHVRFVEGVRVAESEVTREVGTPADFVRIKSPRTRPRTSGISDPEADRHAEVEALVGLCRSWDLSPQDLKELA